MISFMLGIKEIKRQMFKFMLLSIFFLIFGFVYEKFSHQVYSNYMMYAFLIPLFAFIVYLIFYLVKKPLYKLCSSLFNASIITFTIGSIIKGVLDIYGTTNKLVLVYGISGGVPLIISIVTFLKTKYF